jgi:hypothetical protein
LVREQFRIRRISAGRRQRSEQSDVVVCSEIVPCPDLHSENNSS